MTILLYCPLMIALAMALTGCKEDSDPGPPLRPVLTTTVRANSTVVFGPFASIVEPRYETLIGFQTTGRLISRDVSIGDIVKDGQRLATIDPTLAKLAVIRAQADVADANAQLEKAQGVADRQKILTSKDVSPQSSLDSATSGLATAKALLDQNEAALQQAQQQVEYTQLHANFDGVVTSWSAEVGQIVNSGQGVVKVARPDVREAVVDIPDDKIDRVEINEDFTASVEGAPKVTARALVREIAPLADAATRSRRVRLTLQDPPDAFRIGTTITVLLRLPRASTILIPVSAVVTENESKYVWVLAEDGKQVARRTIEVNGLEDEQVVVKSGLKDGEKVVILGVHSLKDGENVAGGITTTTVPGSLNK